MRYEQEVLVKVDADLKRKMKRMNVNWSALIRGFISERISKERNTLEAEVLRMRLFRKASGLDSADIIRQARDARYEKNWFLTLV